MSLRLQKITPFLWFDHQAEEAAHFYASVFKDSKIGTVVRCGKSGPGPEGSVLTIEFEIEGLRFTALNGGPHYTINEGISFVVSCENQEEVDYYWEKLTDGGTEVACGWLRDRFGVTWQVVPTVLHRLLGDPDPAKARRVTEVMMRMKKLDIAQLEEASRG
jgi:predicted 3-demethylubiquinone-9 3-methyltransferase (glyoxalase superfamily)